MYAVGRMVSVKKIYYFFPIISKSIEANDPRGVASLDTRGLIGRFVCRGPLDIATY